jgi:hypothetical protein
MDTADMSFDAGPIHAAFPGLPGTIHYTLLARTMCIIWP